MARVSGEFKEMQRKTVWKEWSEYKEMRPKYLQGIVVGLIDNCKHFVFYSKGI